ncbi:MAG: hypothetical protein K2F59_02505, partial [Eubacteriales bacterium]|nr:hypothetical protein [Eubacteriales bacterium]
MYELKKQKSFKRIFEEIDENLVFCEIIRTKTLEIIEAIPETRYEYDVESIHLFYHNNKNKKPPFDVAINDYDLGIEYITFCLSNELIEKIFKPLEIILKDENIYFNFNEKPNDN